MKNGVVTKASFRRAFYATVKFSCDIKNGYHPQEYPLQEIPRTVTRIFSICPTAYCFSQSKQKAYLIRLNFISLTRKLHKIIYNE